MTSEPVTGSILGGRAVTVSNVRISGLSAARVAGNMAARTPPDARMWRVFDTLHAVTYFAPESTRSSPRPAA